MVVVLVLVRSLVGVQASVVGVEEVGKMAVVGVGGEVRLGRVAPMGGREAVGARVWRLREGVHGHRPLPPVVIETRRRPQRVGHQR